MSYLLDALRKSESERSRTRAPDLTTDHGRARPRARRVPWVPVLVGGALAANAVLLGVWLVRDDAPAAAGPPPGAGDTPAATGGPAPEPASASARTREPVTAAPEAPAPTSPSTPDARETATRATPPRPRAPAPGDAATTETAAPAADEPAPVVNVRDLPERLQRRIPALTFSTHIYAAQPRYREVGINGRRYAEGAEVAGMRLVEITETGVVLELDGRRFAVSVLEDWDY